MNGRRFHARITEVTRGRAVVTVPFDPDEAWGAKAVHHVIGTVNGCRLRTTLTRDASGWTFTLDPARLLAAGVNADADAVIELAPEGPQRGDLAEDLAAALAADPGAGAFFDTLAQFYRKAYLRYIDATKRRPDLRAGRIAEVAGLLADGIKERPRPQAQQELPGVSRSASEVAVNLALAQAALITQIERPAREAYGLSASMFQALAILDGAGEPIPGTSSQGGFSSAAPA